MPPLAGHDTLDDTIREDIAHYFIHLRHQNRGTNNANARLAAIATFSLMIWGFDRWRSALAVSNNTVERGAKTIMPRDEALDSPTDEEAEQLWKEHRSYEDPKAVGEALHIYLPRLLDIIYDDLSHKSPKDERLFRMVMKEAEALETWHGRRAQGQRSPSPGGTVQGSFVVSEEALAAERRGEYPLDKAPVAKRKRDYASDDTEEEPDDAERVTEEVLEDDDEAIKEMQTVDGPQVMNGMQMTEEDETTEAINELFPGLEGGGMDF